MDFMDIIMAKKLGGSGGGSGGGADILNENGIIKQQHLPEGYPYVDEKNSNTLTWDGVIGDKFAIPFADGMTFIYMNEAVLTEADLIGGTITISENSGIIEETITHESIAVQNEDGVETLSVLISGAPMVFVFLNDADMGGVVLPKGTYFMSYDYIGDVTEYTASLVCATPVFAEKTVTKIGKEYLPDDIGGVTSYNDLTDKPFWKETVREPVMPSELMPITVFTEEMNGKYHARDEFLSVYEDYVSIVVYDGVEYRCSPYYSEEIGNISIGSFDFSEYPFIIWNNNILTETQGEHSIELYAEVEDIKANYAPFLFVSAQTDSNWEPYLAMEDVEKIQHAYSNGVPVRLSTSRNNGAVLSVTLVTSAFIYASGIINENKGVLATEAYMFRVSDGSLHDSSLSRIGSVIENGNTVPVMYINNRYYKITVASDGTLKATEI